MNIDGNLYSVEDTIALVIVANVQLFLEEETGLCAVIIVCCTTKCTDAVP